MPTKPKRNLIESKGNLDPTKLRLSQGFAVEITGYHPAMPNDTAGLLHAMTSLPTSQTLFASDLTTTTRLGHGFYS